MGCFEGEIDTRVEFKYQRDWIIDYRNAYNELTRDPEIDHFTIRLATDYGSTTLTVDS